MTTMVYLFSVLLLVLFLQMQAVVGLQHSLCFSGKFQDNLECLFVNDVTGIV